MKNKGTEMFYYFQVGFKWLITNHYSLPRIVFYLLVDNDKCGCTVKAGIIVFGMINKNNITRFYPVNFIDSVTNSSPLPTTLALIKAANSFTEMGSGNFIH
jgi:hypothetical protein